MKSNISKLSNTRIKATITIGKDELEAAESIALAKLSKDVKAAGFRKGKAPASVVKKSVSPSALADETLNTAINKAVIDTFIENDVQVIERPQVEVSKYVPGQELELTAESDIVPPVKLGDYKKLKVEKQAVKVTAKEVDEVIERMRQGMAEKKPVDRAAKDGDEVVIDFVGKKDGKAFDGGAAEGHTITLGSNSFIPGFEKSVEGHKAGESFDIEVSFPKDYHVEDLKGQPVVFETKLNEVREANLPEVNDELAAKAGDFTSIKDLKDDIKREITANKERQAENDYQDALVKKLIEVSDVTAPESLIEDQMKSIEQDVMQNLVYQNVTLDQYVASQGYKDTDEWRAKELKPSAEMRVKSGLVLSELTKQESITASDEEIEAQIETYKAQYGKTPEVEKQFADPAVRRDVANRVVTEKAVNKLVELNSK